MEEGKRVNHIYIMFSANENLMLRQHKRRIVEQVEATMPEEALDMGTTVMVMQVSCKAPGCVPLETAIIVVFPASSSMELIPGLPESQSSSGGNYKTKILKPMAEVTNDDVLDALPPAFIGGKRTIEKLCINARDVMLAQITQLFGGDEDDNTVPDRRAMAEYLQLCLQQYIDNNCIPPELGQPIPLLEEKQKELETDDMVDTIKEKEVRSSSSVTTTTTTISTAAKPGKGNLVIRRVIEEEPPASLLSNNTKNNNNNKNNKYYGSGKPKKKYEKNIQQALNPLQSNSISKLFSQEHAPGIRQPGCPCCDPDNPNNIVDQMMMI